MPLEDVAMGVVAGAAFLREAPDSAAEGAATRRPIELLKLARNWREIGAKLAPDWRPIGPPWLQPVASFYGANETAMPQIPCFSLAVTGILSAFPWILQ